MERVREFIKKGQSMARDDCDYTALHYASRNGNEQICKVLLDEGKADVNAVTKAGATSLHRAAMMGRFNRLTQIITIIYNHFPLNRPLGDCQAAGGTQGKSSAPG